MTSLSFWEPLQGRTRLWKVVWLYGLALTVVYSLIGLAVPLGNSAATWIYGAIGILITVYQLAALWQCAFNGPSRVVAVLVRVSVVLSLLLVPVLIYLYATQPALFDLGEFA
jgi:hypothetical protein